MLHGYSQNFKYLESILREDKKYDTKMQTWIELAKEAFQIQRKGLRKEKKILRNKEKSAGL